MTDEIRAPVCDACLSSVDVEVTCNRTIMERECTVCGAFGRWHAMSLKHPYAFSITATGVDGRQTTAEAGEQMTSKREYPNLPDCAEKSVALRKILEAKDAAVRTAIGHARCTGCRRLHPAGGGLLCHDCIESAR